MTIYIDQDTLLRVNIHAPYKGRSKLDTPEILEAVGVIEIAEPPAPNDFSEDTYYRTEQDASPYVVYTPKSAEQIAQVTLSKAKQQRAQAVAAIKVTTLAGNEFDGDEEAQGRMARAIVALPDDVTIVPWVMADNAVVPVTKPELREALQLSLTAMATEWIKPYES